MDMVVMKTIKERERMKKKYIFCTLVADIIIINALREVLYSEND